MKNSILSLHMLPTTSQPTARARHGSLWHQMPNRFSGTVRRCESWDRPRSTWNCTPVHGPPEFLFFLHACRPVVTSLLQHVHSRALFTLYIFIILVIAVLSCRELLMEKKAAVPKMGNLHSHKQQDYDKLCKLDFYKMTCCRSCFTY